MAQVKVHHHRIMIRFLVAKPFESTWLNAVITPNVVDPEQGKLPGVSMADAMPSDNETVGKSGTFHLLVGIGNRRVVKVAA